MNKWMALPALAGVLTLGGVAAATGVPSGEKPPEPVMITEEAGNASEAGLDREQGRVVYDMEPPQAAVAATELPASTNHTLTVVSSDEEQAARSLLTKQEAIDIAMRHAAGKVTDMDIEKEKEDGRIVYEIEMEDEMFEYELLMDAVTGDIITFEQD